MADDEQEKKHNAKKMAEKKHNGKKIAEDQEKKHSAKKIAEDQEKKDNANKYKCSTSKRNALEDKQFKSGSKRSRSRSPGKKQSTTYQRRNSEVQAHRFTTQVANCPSTSKSSASSGALTKEGGCQICRKHTSTIDSFKCGACNKWQHRHCTPPDNPKNLCEYCARRIKKTSSVLHLEPGFKRKTLALRKKGLNSGEVTVSIPKLSASQVKKPVIEKKHMGITNAEEDNSQGKRPVMGAVDKSLGKRPVIEETHMRATTHAEEDYETSDADELINVMAEINLLERIDHLEANLKANQEQVEANQEEILQNQTDMMDRVAANEQVLQNQTERIEAILQNQTDMKEQLKAVLEMISGRSKPDQ